VRKVYLPKITEKKTKTQAHLTFEAFENDLKT